MTKRIFIILLVLVLSFTLVVFPVSASSEGNSWNTNLLDLTFVNGTNNSLTFVGSATYTLSIPYSLNVSYVDVLFTNNSSIASSLSWSLSGGSRTELTVVHLGNQLYRAYGNVPNRQGSSFDLTFSDSRTSTIYVTVYSVNVGKKGLSAFPDVGNITFSKPAVSTVTMSSSSAPATATFPATSLSEPGFDYSDFYGWVKVPSWNKYDYVDIFLIADTTTIDSITASVGGTSLPMEISYLNGTVPGFNSSIGGVYVPEYDSWVPDVSHVSVLRYIRLSIDVSDLDRTVGSDLYIYLSGIYDFINGGSVSLSSVTGHVFLNSTSTVEYWIRRIFTSVESGFDKLASILNPDSSVVDSAISEADQAITGIHDMEQQYAADLDSSVITGEVSKVENYGNALVFCGSVLSRTFGQLDGYQIIYILPICVGLFLFVASRARPIHVPRQHSAPKANDTQVLDNKEG